MTSHCITWHDTTQAITSHQMTWPSHDLTPEQTSRHQNTSLQSTKHHHHGRAEGSFTAKKWFGHRAGRSPCAHSIGKFFLCYIVLFLLETSAPGLSGYYWYGIYGQLASGHPWLWNIQLWRTLTIGPAISKCNSVGSGWCKAEWVRIILFCFNMVLKFYASATCLFIGVHKFKRCCFTSSSQFIFPGEIEIYMKFTISFVS